VVVNDKKGSICAISMAKVLVSTKPVHNFFLKGQLMKITKELSEPLAWTKVRCAFRPEGYYLEA
jgi:hypothetical protein